MKTTASWLENVALYVVVNDRRLDGRCGVQVRNAVTGLSVDAGWFDGRALVGCGHWPQLVRDMAARAIASERGVAQ